MKATSNSLRKATSILLTVLMMLGMFTALPFVADATETDTSSVSATSGYYTYEILRDNTAEITSYNGSESTVRIPSWIAGHTVSSIGASAFFLTFDGGYTTSVIIPGSVKTIKTWAFGWGTDLKSITLEEGIESIGQWAFDGCTSITSIRIPKSVYYIADEAFLECDNLKTIYGYSGSAAEAYAKSSGIKFVSIDTPVKKTTVTLSRYSGSVYVKGSLQIHATVKNGSGRTTYRSSNTRVARVTSRGKVTGVRRGSAVITVKNHGVSKKFRVTVKNPRLNATSKTLYKGKSFTLRVTGRIGKAKFSSSNKRVATVSSGGKVTAKGKGSATVTVKANGVTLRCKVKVNNPKLNVTSKTLNKGKSFTLKVTGRVGKAKFSSSNKKVATVSSGGKVTAKGKGSATITVKTNGVTLKCKVTVKVPKKRVSVKISKTSLKLYNSSSYKLSVRGGSGKIKWSSSNRKIATVSSSGVVVGLKAGSCTITATRNGVSVKCKVTVPSRYKLNNEIVDFGAFYGFRGTLSGREEHAVSYKYDLSKYNYSKEEMAKLGSNWGDALVDIGCKFYGITDDGYIAFLSPSNYIVFFRYYSNSGIEIAFSF